MTLGQLAERHTLLARLRHFVPGNIVKCWRTPQATSLVDGALQTCLRPFDEQVALELRNCGDNAHRHPAC